MLNYAVARSPRGSRIISTSASSLLIEFTKAYFDQVDNGRLPDELFTPDFEFYFPKYGVGRGFEEFRELATGLASTGYKAMHHRHSLKYIACGQQVIVEGTTSGTDGEGNTWNGGKRQAGASAAFSTSQTMDSSSECISTSTRTIRAVTRTGSIGDAQSRDGDP
jgi:SnoaL-like domain